jgi:hypothetical protein
MDDTGASPCLVRRQGGYEEFGRAGPMSATRKRPHEYRPTPRGGLRDGKLKERLDQAERSVSGSPAAGRPGNRVIWPWKSLASGKKPSRPWKRSFAHVHWFRTAKTCSRCRKIERTLARYSAMNDTLAVIACAALGCGCGEPKCGTVVNAVLVASGMLPPPADGQPVSSTTVDAR